MSRLLRCLTVTLLFVASAVPAIAQSDRGHGAIYYSASGHRIGWAKSLDSDDVADRSARAECVGGTFDSVMMARYNARTAGPAATAQGALPMSVAVNDCRKIIKFDSKSNHQCAGFGYNPDGSISNGTRERDYASVQSDLSGWSQTFIICNDDKSVSGGIIGFLDALDRALNGSTRTPAPAPAPTAPPYVAPIPPLPYGGYTGVFGNPKSITLFNTTPNQLQFTIQCPTETSGHFYVLDTKVRQTLNASDWNQSCVTFSIAITTQNPDGSSTEVDKVLDGGASYEFFVNGTKNALDVRRAMQPMTIVNDVASPIQYRVICPNAAPIDLTIAANGTDTSGLPCPTGSIRIASGTNTDATYRTFPVVNGATYHITYDATAQVLNLVRDPASK